MKTKVYNYSYKESTNRAVGEDYNNSVITCNDMD